MKIVHGKAVSVRAHKSEYELKVTGMCGDADAYNKNTVYFKNDAEGLIKLEWTLFMLNLYELIPQGYHTDRKHTDVMFHRVKSQYNIDLYESSDMLSDLVGRDSTADNQWFAALDGLELFYWDDHGVKYNAKVEWK